MKVPVNRVAKTKVLEPIVNTMNVIPKTVQNGCKPKHCRNVTMMKIPKKRTCRASMDFNNDLINGFQAKGKNCGSRNIRPKTIKSTIMFKDITLE